MALRQGRREDVERAAYYVWFLGAEESRGLRGRQYVAPVVAELVRKERHVEPCKVTLQVSGKGMKIVQHAARGRAGHVKHFVPDHAVTCAVREPAPDDDIVSCILLVFNPVTKCPVHVHTYRCDTPETAQMLEAQLQTLAGRPENKARIQQIEARLVERGLLAAPPPPQQQPGGSVRQKSSRSGSGRHEPGSKAGYQEDSSGIGSDDTASPDHRERTSSDEEEEWEETGASSEDLLQDSSSRWRQNRSPPSAVPPGRVEWSRGLSSPHDEDEDEDAPPPPPQRPPPELVPEAPRAHHPDYSRSWRHSRPHPEGGRGIYEERSRLRPREEGRSRSGGGHRRSDEPLPVPPGGEPRPEELLSRVDRWVLSSVAVAETAAPGVRRRHSGRQHAERRVRSPSEDPTGRLTKSRSTDTFLEHDVMREPWRRPPAAHVAEEMRRQSVARDEPVQRSRSSAHVGEEARRSAPREETVQRCRSSPQVTEDMRRRLAAREAREARDGREARDLRDIREVRDAREARGLREAREERDATRDLREIRESPRPRRGMQRCRSSTSLLDQRSPDRARLPESAGGWRGDHTRRWGTLDRDLRERPSSRRREQSRDSELRYQVARELRPAEGSARSRGPRAGSRTPDSELWMSGADSRGRSRYSVADPRGVREYDYRPSLIAQPY